MEIFEKLTNLDDVCLALGFFDYLVIEKEKDRPRVPPVIVEEKEEV